MKRIHAHSAVGRPCAHRFLSGLVQTHDLYLRCYNIKGSLESR